MRFRDTADDILSQPTKTKLLRFLIKNRPAMTGRELAKFCKISHMQTYRVLNGFESYGIIKKIRVGKANLYSLNEKNILLKDILVPLFKKEKVILKTLLQRLFIRVKNKILSMTVFGSAMEGKERPAGDTDIFILVKNAKTSGLLENILSDIEVNFYEQTGNKLSPVVFTLKEFKKYQKTNKSLVSKISSGKVIIGKSPGEFIRGN